MKNTYLSLSKAISACNDCTLKVERVKKNTTIGGLYLKCIHLKKILANIYFVTEQVRPRLDQRKSIGNVQETHSRGIIFSLIVWNKGSHRKLSKETATTPVLLEES